MEQLKFDRYHYIRPLVAFLVSLLISEPGYCQRLLTDSAKAWETGLRQPVKPGVWKDGCIRHGDPDETFEVFSEIYRYFGHIGGGLLYCAGSEDEYPRLGKYTMAPHVVDRAVKQWVSDYEGPITLIIDAQKLQSDGDGQRLVVRRNDRELMGRRITMEDPHFTNLIRTDVQKGDAIKVILDARDNQAADWTAVRVKIYEGRHLGFPQKATMLTFDQSNRAPQGWIRSERDVLHRVPDESGRGNPAFCLCPTESEHYQLGVRGNAMAFDGYRPPLKLSADNLGNGAEELSISFWMSPHMIQDMHFPTILSSSGADFVAVSLSDFEKGNL